MENIMRSKINSDIEILNQVLKDSFNHPDLLSKMMSTRFTLNWNPEIVEINSIYFSFYRIVDNSPNYPYSSESDGNIFPCFYLYLPPTDCYYLRYSSHGLEHKLKPDDFSCIENIEAKLFEDMVKTGTTSSTLYWSLLHKFVFKNFMTFSKDYVILIQYRKNIKGIPNVYENRSRN